MSGVVDRENQIFGIIQAFKDAGLEFIVVGGYAVSAFQHRFSVDAALVIQENNLDDFVKILENRGFEQVENRELVNGDRFLAYKTDSDRPVTIDLLVDSLHCRQTNASWNYQYFSQYATTVEIQGSEQSVEVRIPEPELLLAIKLHSGRLTDARDAVALATNIDLGEVEKHLAQGDQERLQKVLEDVLETISREDFEDAFKGVFELQDLPEDDIKKLQEFIRGWVDR